MKNLKLFVAILLVLTSVSGEIVAYKYIIKNETDRDLRVKLFWGVRSELNNKFELIKTGTARRFKFGGVKTGLCLNEIEVKAKENGKWKIEKAQIIWKKLAPTLTLKNVVKFATQVCGDKIFSLQIDRATQKIVAVVEQ